MTQPKNSPLNSQLFRLEYPRSLGTYATYAEVQAVVDTLADKQFPVQHTLIVGTDLKLMERVTGRQTWGRVILGGILSGAWMGLFIGILFALFAPQPQVTVISSVLIGIVFFTIWSVIGYAASGGKRDFTSMTSTIPMQYELLVEHRHADEARRLLVEEGAAQPFPRQSAAPLPHAELPGQPPEGQSHQGQSHQGRPHQDGLHQGGPSADGWGHPQAQPGSDRGRHAQGRYGQPAADAPADPGSARSRPTNRRSFGQPAPQDPVVPVHPEDKTPGQPEG